MEILKKYLNDKKKENLLTQCIGCLYNCSNNDEKYLKFIFFDFNGFKILEKIEENFNEKEKRVNLFNNFLKKRILNFLSKNYFKNEFNYKNDNFLKIVENENFIFFN
jgi:hypothetical protein